MSKRSSSPAGKILCILGVLLILLSAFLFLRVKNDGKNSAEENELAVEYLTALLEERTVGYLEERNTPEMPALEYRGRDLAALLEVPGHGVVLPVLAEWNQRTVNSVPCRFSGNPYDGSLVIGGVDAVGLFDFIPRTDIGDRIILTDMKGCEFRYTVSDVRHAKDGKAKTLQSGSGDLTLFARSAQNGDYLLVQCVLD